MRLTIDLSGRTALVCGAGGGGIGTATSRLLAQAGANIVAVDRNAELVAETVAMVERIGGRCHPLVADLRDAAQAARVVQESHAAAGRIDLVANIAGGMQPDQWGRFEGTPEQVYRDIVALNLDYVFIVCRDAARLMKAQRSGGAMVNVASVSALPSAPFHAPYAAAKSGVIALTRSMAVELGQSGIRANVVAPGATKTERAARLAGDSLDRRQKDWAPLGRAVTSDEIAQAIVFLLSDLASAITGQTVAVDCGITARCVLGGLEHFESRLSW
jgi:NAD(P)-dependent dehydrogenase (short-subunit alcohol dehydrogenase family)